jgi:hypothetical protein
MAAKPEQAAASSAAPAPAPYVVRVAVTLRARLQPQWDARVQLVWPGAREDEAAGRPTSAPLSELSDEAGERVWRAEFAALGPDEASAAALRAAGIEFRVEERRAEPPEAAVAGGEAEAKAAKKPAAKSAKAGAEKKDAGDAMTPTAPMGVALAPLLAGERVLEARPWPLPASLSAATVRVELSAPLLPPAVSKALLPLLVTVAEASQLPSEALAPDTRAVCEVLLPGEPAPTRSVPRPSGARVEFAHSSVFFLGKSDLAEFASRVASEPLRLQVHFGLPTATVAAAGIDAPPPAAFEEPAAAGSKGAKAAKAVAPAKRVPSGGKKAPGATGDASEASGAEAAPPTPAVAWPPHMFGYALVRLEDLFLGARSFEVEAELLPSLAREAGRVVNPFFESGSTVRVVLRLAEPLPTRLHQRAAHRFARIILLFPANDEARLAAALNAVADANLAALGMSSAPRRALASVQLSEAQRADASNLDVLTGAHVIDSERHILVIEGLREGASFAGLLRAVAPHEPNTPHCKMLACESVSFPHRLYSSFHVDLKHVRLREPLSRLAAQTRVALRKKLPAECYRALHALWALAACETLREVQRASLFPTPAELLALERKFGDAVSDRDLAIPGDGDTQASTPREGEHVAFTGSTPREPQAQTQPVTHAAVAHSHSRRRSSALSLRAHRPASRAPRLVASAPLPPLVTVAVSQKRRGSIASSVSLQEERRASIPQAATSSSQEQQPQQQQLQAQRHQQQSPKDYIQANKDAVAAMCKGTYVRRADRPFEVPEHGVFVYSGQRLEYSEWQKRRMRERMAAQRDTYFTYSLEFQSLAASMVDEVDVAREEKRLEESKRLTPSGFRWPAPRAPEDFRRHPLRPSTARREELRAPWAEPGKRAPRTVEEVEEEEEKARVAAKRGDFRVFVHSAPEFGFPGNADWGRSVHLGGDALVLEARERANREKEQWRERLVVEDPVFRVCLAGHEPGHRLAQIDRTCDILHDSPRKRGLQPPRHHAVLDASRLAVEPPPLSMFLEEPYVSPREGTVKRDETRGAPRFVTSVGRDSLLPRTRMHKRHIAPLPEEAKVGPKWFTAPPAAT